MATRAVVICKYDTFIVFYTQVLVAFALMYRWRRDRFALTMKSICTDEVWGRELIDDKNYEEMPSLSFFTMKRTEELQWPVQCNHWPFSIQFQLLFY